MSKKNQSRKKHSRNHSGRNYFQNASAVSNRTVRYNPNQKVLSISMLVSGREETTEKSIDSLSRLRERVSSELILVDTGCSEEMHRRLAEKADRIIRFAWCDDFSAARNVAVQAATGQWFMFLDDDEWFEDTTELENFFLSGDYRMYESASYVQRNYLDMEGDKWRDIHVTRMTKMRPQTRFFYAIHESLWPLLEPEKYFDAYVHHFGYASPDPEVQMAKRQRNLKLLLPTIEGDPHCMKHYLQAVAEYNAMNDYKSACDMADKGIANCDPSRVENAAHIDALYAAAVRMRLEQRKMEEAACLGKDYVENAPINELSKASICGDLTFICGELEEYEECLDYFRRYTQWKDYFAENREKQYRQDTLILDICFEEVRYSRAMGWGFAAALALGKTEEAEALLAEKPLDLWLNAVRDWYTFVTPRQREKWQSDFRGMMERLGRTETAVECRMDRWDERGGACPHLRQFYGILTMPETPPIPVQTGSSAAEAEKPSKQEKKPSACEEKTPMQAEKPAVEEEKQAVHEEKPLAQKSVSGQEISAEQEMESLKAQLKDKVRFLMKQGQYQAAHGVVMQLRGFFPGDPELMELQVLCESRL